MSAKRKKSHDAVWRQWQILRQLPRYPKKITAGDIQKQLANDGYPTYKRNVERDLQDLLTFPDFHIELDDRERPYGWSWSKEANVLGVPGLTTTQALTFVLVQRFLTPLLPASALEELRPYFQSAEEKLSRIPKERGIPSWSRKIRIIQPTQRLLPPRIDAHVRNVVYESLLDSRQIRINYHKPGAAEPIEYAVHPLGLVQRGSVAYLVGTLFHYEDVRTLALHRILSAIELDAPATYPDGFDLDRYIASGELDFGNGKKIRLDALFTTDAGEHLHETALSADQKITPVNKNRVRVRATVLDTPQLRWWLRGFGDQAEVVRPKSLRREMIEMVRSMGRFYR